MTDSLPDLFQPDKYPKSYSGLPPKWRDKIAEGTIPELIKRVQAMGGEIDKFESGSLTDLGGRYDEGREEYRGNIQAALAEVDKYSKLASRGFENQGQRALQGAMPGILNQLANRNVINSSMGSDAIAKAAAEIVPLYSQMGYDAAMEAARTRHGLNAEQAETLLGLTTSQATSEQGIRSEAMGHRAGMPAMLAGVAALSNYSKNTNELAPYQLLANFIMGY